MFNKTPLFDAAKSSNLQIVQLLINHGANIDAKDSNYNNNLISTLHSLNQFIQII